MTDTLRTRPADARGRGRRSPARPANAPAGRHVTTAAPTSGFLTPFTHGLAAEVASWVTSTRELTWLAPATVPPLTPQKVIDWERDRGNRFLYWIGGAPDGTRTAAPCGYAELNPMPQSRDRFWIGHLLTDPRRRKQGIGTAFARVLVATAFARYGARELLLVVFPENTVAIRCYERAGMSVTGRERSRFPQTGQEHEFLRMSITASQYARLAASGCLPATPPLIRRPA